MRLILLICLLALFQTQAGLMTPLPIEELTRQSQLIVRGTVLSKNCQKDPEGRIYTKMELNVAEVWKGNPNSNPLIIVHGGGVFGQERVVVSDQVEYNVGEEIVGFFVINQRGEAVTLGLSQGKFHVQHTTKGEVEVHNPFHGMSRTNTAIIPELGRTVLSLTTLHDRVETVKP